MRKRYMLLSLFFIMQGLYVIAQPYAIVIKGGHVIDIKNHIDGIMDVAVNDGKIVGVGRNIDVSQAAQVVDAAGLYVVPGLIDIHAHVFHGTEKAYSNGHEGIVPDGFSFRTGVTTMVDAGSVGWKQFELFQKEVIGKNQTRILAFLNIVGGGMRGGNFEQDTTDMDGAGAAEVAKKYPDQVVGFKVAHYVGASWRPVDQAVLAGTLAGGIPVMIDFGSAKPALSIESLYFQHLRPGDIFTHCYGQLWDREFIVDTLTSAVKPFVWKARQRGIIFDVGYGEISFAFSQAIPACKEKFYPSSISTDMHARSINQSMKDILNVSSQFMALGMPLDSVVAAVTWNPAREIHHEELGHLTVGAVADIAVLDLRKGKFGYFDYTGRRVSGATRLECQLTIKGGRIMYDLNGIAKPPVLPRPVRRPPAAAAGGAEH